MKADAVAPSRAVVERVAASEGVEQTELPPLYETIDSEAVDALVETSRNSDSDLQIEFTYRGYEVTVTGDGAVRIAEGEDFRR